MLNTVAVQGRLTKNPELKTTQGGLSVCSFDIAVDRDYKKDGERQTDFLTVVTWRQTAEIVARNCHKGEMIIVKGRIETRKYQDKQGNNRTAFEIVAESVNFTGSKGQVESPKTSYNAPQGNIGVQYEETDEVQLPF